MLSYYVNYKFSRKNELNSEIVKFRFNFIKLYLSGALLAIILIATMWAIIYLIYPFKITQNFYSKSNLPIDIISYGLGNTLEELLFRGFLLIATIKLLGKASGVLFVSFLFGLFHLQGTGLTTEGLRMVMTTFSMSLLFISTIYYTKSIWTAVVVHITGNLLLHTLGFDGTNSGLFQITFVRSNVNGIVISIIYEIVVITFTLFIFSRTKKQI
jgi:membrane protease YdiL (CAAX protease family)